MCAVSPVVHTPNIYSLKKKRLSFPVAVNNSSMIGTLVILLQMFVIRENIMKPPVFFGVVVVLTVSSDCNNIYLKQNYVYVPRKPPQIIYVYRTNTPQTGSRTHAATCKVVTGSVVELTGRGLALTYHRI